MSCRSPLVSDQDRHPTQEQRALERMRKSGRIRFYRDVPDKPAMGEIVDVSPNGMRFQCNVKLVPRMTIKIGSHDLKAVAVVAHVCKMIDRNRIAYIVGVTFLSVQFRQSKDNFHSTYT